MKTASPHVYSERLGSYGSSTDCVVYRNTFTKGSWSKQFIADSDMVIRQRGAVADPSYCIVRFYQQNNILWYRILKIYRYLTLYLTRQNMFGKVTSTPNIFSTLCKTLSVRLFFIRINLHISYWKAYLARYQIRSNIDVEPNGCRIQVLILYKDLFSLAKILEIW
jgi:hypothetical protein